MADWDDRTRQGFGSVPRAGGDVASRTTYDAGLRKYMLSIYNYMTSGVLLTGIVAHMKMQGVSAGGGTLWTREERGRGYA